MPNISGVFAWLEGVLEPMLDVFQSSKAEKEVRVDVAEKEARVDVVPSATQGRVEAAEPNDRAEAVMARDHVEKRLSEIRLKKADFSSSMKERFRIATDISELRQKSSLLPDDVFKIKLQKKLDAYSQADFTVKEARQDLGRLEQQHLHACDTEIAVFKRPASRESASDVFKQAPSRESTSGEPTPRFPNFPFAYSQSARTFTSTSAGARSKSPTRRSKRFTQAAAKSSSDVLALRARSSER